MQFFYGNKTPLRVLDELEFWKHQENEHTVVIRQIVPDLEKNFVEELKDWGLAFAEAKGVAVRYIETVNRSLGAINPVLYQEIRQFTIFCINQSLGFVAFLNTLIAESQAVRKNDLAVIVINHIRRESEYSAGIAKAALEFF